MTRVKLNREEKAFGLSSTVKFSSQTQGFRSDSDSFNPLCVRRILTPALMKPRSVQVPLHCAVTTWAKDFRPILHEDCSVKCGPSLQFMSNHGTCITQPSSLTPSSANASCWLPSALRCCFSYVFVQPSTSLMYGFFIYT